MSQDGSGTSLQPLPVVLPQGHELGSSFDAVHCLFSDSFEEKFDPGLPGRLLTDSQKQIGIFRTMLLEIRAQVEQRFSKCCVRKAAAESGAGRLGRCHRETGGWLQTGNATTRDQPGKAAPRGPAETSRTPQGLASSPVQEAVQIWLLGSVRHQLRYSFAGRGILQDFCRCHARPSAGDDVTRGAASATPEARGGV